PGAPATRIVRSGSFRAPFRIIAARQRVRVKVGTEAHAPGVTSLARRRARAVDLVTLARCIGHLVEGDPPQGACQFAQYRERFVRQASPVDALLEEGRGTPVRD